VLALLCAQPAHGWALASQLGREGEVGAIWSLGRPLVYRSLEILEQRGLIEAAGMEPGARGPSRTVYQPTEEGREALEQWLHEPVEHIRDIRSLFLLKLIFAERAGISPVPMLRAQREVIVPTVESLEARLAEKTRDPGEVLLRFRLESTRAVVRFIDGLLADNA
jgi:PadR family transcriptional regulator AphA